MDLILTLSIKDMQHNDIKYTQRVIMTRQNEIKQNNFRDNDRRQRGCSQND